MKRVSAIIRGAALIAALFLGGCVRRCECVVVVDARNGAAVAADNPTGTGGATSALDALGILGEAAINAALALIF